MIQNKYDIIVAGGGFFGSTIALYYANTGKSVLLVEKEDSIMKRASLNNQARVHGGYHYPRSILTGLRSLENYRIFLERYRNCIDNSFKKYYAISRKFSNVSAHQFAQFCSRIGAPIKDAPPKISKLFSIDLVEAVFEVEECVFNADLLRKATNKALESAGVTILLTSEVVSIHEGLTVKIRSDADSEFGASEIFLCTYAEMNKVLMASNLPVIPLHHEFTEIALVTPPPTLEGMGVTVMCGPFFSIMPFPTRNLYSFSHVRYTPHYRWNVSKDSVSQPPEVSKSDKTRFMFMLKDSLRYLPILKTTAYVDSIWEVKTVLPRSDGDDSRPILFKQNHGLSGVHCIIGGKIDNVFDVINKLKDLNEERF